MSPELRATAEYAETPEYTTPAVLVLDFDRMLGDINLVMERVYSAAEAIGIDPVPIKAAREDTEGKKSFDALGEVRTYIAPEDHERFEDFKRHFVTGQPDSPGILYPDADRLMQRLASNNVPHIIMTYGTNPEWQSLKMMAAGYPMGYIVTSTKDKGPIIDQLRNDDGSFTMYNPLEGVAYNSEDLIFIDDKADAFANFSQEPGYQGLWIQRGKLLDHQKGKVPANVGVIGSLDELSIGEDGSVSLTGTPATAPQIPGQRLVEHEQQRNRLYIPLIEGVVMISEVGEDQLATVQTPVVQFQLTA